MHKVAHFFKQIWSYMREMWSDIWSDEPGLHPALCASFILNVSERQASHNLACGVFCCTWLYPPGAILDQT